MRTKSETRRQAILQAATRAFQGGGFERTSMEDIRVRVGCSKPTLYSYFASKEELFFAVMREATEAEFQATHAALDPSQPDIARALQSFGERLLNLLYSPQVQAVRRLVVSEAGRSDLGRQCRELGPRRSEAAIAAFLRQAMEQGQLRAADTQIAAQQLKALLEAEWIERFLFHTLDAFSAAEIAASVERAVAVFMAAYGPSARPPAHSPR